MEEKNLNYLFNEMPLYTKEEFEVFNINDDQYEINERKIKDFCKYIGVNQNKIITYCHKCKKEFPFLVNKKCIGFAKDINQEYDYMIFTKNFKNAPSGRLDVQTGQIWGGLPPYNSNFMLNNKIYYIEYSLECTNEENHRYMMMISIEIKDTKFIVRKIGQNPSMLTVKGFDFDKYKRILEEINAYEDYKKADLSYVDKFYVGAFAYLRRIFEKLLKKFIGDQKLKDDHIDTKIKFTKELFDPRIQGILKNMYSILSVSIHELDEEESKEYYEDLKAILDMQFEYMKTEYEKRKQSERLSATLNKIVNNLKKMD